MSTTAIGYMVGFLLLAFLLLPVLTFLVWGWPARRREILNSISETGAGTYLKQFFPNEYPEGGTLKNFASHYDQRFGRRLYAVPLLFLALIGALLSALMISELMRTLGATESSILAIPLVSIAAGAGGYMWAFNDLIGRARRFDLAPVHLNGATFRLVISIPMGTAVSALFADPIGAPLAFLLGAFPTNTLFTIARRLASRRLDLGDEGKKESELERLQGIDTEVAERFLDEGISNIVQLAYCDPIDLTMRSNRSFSYVADCVSQALAWLYFEDKLPVMRQYSARGAQEIYTLVDELAGDDEESKAAQHTLSLLAKKIELDEKVLTRTLREISLDPYTKFLADIWQTGK